MGNDEVIPLQNSRLRKHHIEYDFIAEGYDDENIQDSKIELAKWPKRGTNLMLEIKEDVNTKFAYFDPNSILISLFIVTESNTAKLVERGFVQSATFKAQELPSGDICSIVVDSKMPLKEIKPILFKEICSNNIVPKEWMIEQNEFDAQQLNLIKCDYNIKLGAMIFIELQITESEIANDDKSEIITMP